MSRIFIIGYSKNKGGVETYIDQLAGTLTQHDFVYNMPIMEIDGKVWRRPENRHNYLKYRLFWRKFFKENQFDAIYYNTCDIVSIDMLKFAKNANIPIRIIHSHNTGNQQAIENGMSLFHQLSEAHHRRTLDQYATHLLACSEAAGNWMFDGREYTVVENGIDISDYQFIMTNRRRIRDSITLNDEPLIGIIGRLDAQKNPIFAVQVFEEVLKILPSARAVFLGEGNLQSQVNQALYQMGIQDNVMFAGKVNNVNEWLSAFDVLLMPSLFEGLPFALIEAQANGLPCVVSSAITQEANITGLLTYEDLNDNPKTWAQDLISVIGKRKMDTAKQLIEAGYDIKTSVKEVAKIIEGK